MILRAEVRWALLSDTFEPQLYSWVANFITNMNSTQTEDKTTAGMCQRNLQLFKRFHHNENLCIILWGKWDCRYPTSSKMSYFENLNSSTGIVKAFLKAELNPLNRKVGLIS